MGIFMLGLPLGLLLAFFTIGAMVKAFDSWRRRSLSRPCRD
jgi:hypothetical protein